MPATTHPGDHPDFAPPAYAHAVLARDLRVRAGRTLAVQGVDLALGRGVHGLLGPNGAGKTTLVRALATVVAPASGQLELLGRDAAAADLRGLRRRLGYLPQDLGVYERFTAWEFVAHLAWLKEVPRERTAAAVDRALERVGLGDRAGTRLRHLSGGMRRRVGIAQALVNDPELLLLDEPTAGLDPEQRVAFRGLLRELGADTCVVVATHLVEDVAHACEDVVLLEAGRVVFAGPRAGLEAAAGAAPHEGAGALEAGYVALLRAHRERVR